MISFFNSRNATQIISLAPGEYHIYLYASPNTYTFAGSGNWTGNFKRLYGRNPPSTLPSGSKIILNPYSRGIKCIINTSQTISNGARIAIAENTKVKMPLNLVIQ